MWVILTILFIVGVFLTIRSAVKDADKNTNSETEKMYDAEFGPEAIKFNKALKAANLRKKLNQIEKKRS